jgi:hypothetical protein
MRLKLVPSETRNLASPLREGNKLPFRANRVQMIVTVHKLLPDIELCDEGWHYPVGNAGFGDLTYNDAG